MENKMEYTVKWIINGEITVKAANKDEAETNIKNQLKDLIDKNKKNFNDLGATAIQGSAISKN
jgi:hypothetical protein